MVTGFGNATGLRLNRIAQFYHQVRRPRNELQLDLVDVKFLVIQLVLHGGFLPFCFSDPRTRTRTAEPSALSVAFCLYSSGNLVASVKGIPITTSFRLNLAGSVVGPHDLRKG